MRTLHVCIALFIAAALLLPAAALALTDEELAKQTEDKCVATSGTKPTPDMIKEKIEAACEMLHKEGLAGLENLRGSDSGYIFAGTYIWVHNMDGLMVMHPIKHKLNGRSIIGLKDSNGKLFFAAMNEAAGEKGAAWVDYMWPKPGEEGPSQKVSYVKLCEVEGQQLVLGCGVYDMTVGDLQ